MKYTIRISSLSMLLFIFWFSIQSCGSKSEEIVQTYVSGEVRRTHTEINGKKEGKMTEYYKDGKVKAEMLFENDLQVGKSIMYYPSGKIQQVQYFDKGKLNGGDTTFYESGKPQFLRTFSNGKMDGYIRKWNEHDSIIYEARYAHDTLVEVKGQVLRPDPATEKK